MSNKIFYLQGETKWANTLINPDRKFKRYTVDLYLDEKNLQVFKESGAQNEIRTDKIDGRTFIKVARPTMKLVKDKIREYGPPDLINKDGKPWGDKPIGDGSVVTVKLEVYDTVKGPGCRLEAVRVDKHVEGRAPVEVDESNVDSPF